MRRAFAVVVGVMVLPSIVAVSFANTKTVTDKKGDVVCTGESNHVQACGPKPPADLRSATAAHAGGSKLKHVVRGWTRIKAADVKSFGAVGIEIHAGGHTYFTIGNGGKEEMHIAPSGDVTGKVTVNQVDARTVSFVFAKSAIGNPASYRWRAQDNSACETCRPADRVPNRGLVLHKLR